MGKVGGFLEFKRKDPGYRSRGVRVKDFKAVEERLSEQELCIQAARCMECGTPFCHASGCPLGNCIPEFNDMVYHERWDEAYQLLLSTCSFPEFTGRLCPAPCEASCVLGINDDPVTIRQIELTIIEKAFEQGYIHASPPINRRKQLIAVIGSGPAGLAVADYVNKAGYRVVVFDKGAQPGGILRYGIPDFKLEKWVIDRRVAMMKEEGVVFEMGVTAGKDISYKYLKDRYKVICLTCGAEKPRELSVPGRELKGIHFAMEYLINQNRRNADELVAEDKFITAADKKVAVIGGGDTGSDCIGTAIRQGARRVHQLEILPKPPVERPESTPWPMWPNILRTSSSHLEGGERRWAVCTNEFIGERGHVKKLRGREVECTQNPKSGFVIKEKSGTDFEVEADLVLLAMGFVGPGENRILEEQNVERDSRGNVKVNELHMTSVKGLFAAGDMARGQSLIVRAIHDGRKAAQGIIAWLRSKE